MRETGIEVAGSVPWGTHFCLFYQTQEDLFEVLVPFLSQGLQNNEQCIWITSRPQEVNQARQVLKLAMKDLEAYVDKGQIEILDYSPWYGLTDGFQADGLMRWWAEKERLALEKGFVGVRATGNTSWLEKRDWQSFSAYEAVANSIAREHRIISMCTYGLEQCGPFEVIDVVSNHQFALIKQAGRWQTIQSQEHQKAEAGRRESEERFRAIFDKAAIGIALINAQTQIVLTNPELQQMLGYTAAELQGLAIEQITHPEDWKIEQPLGRELLTGQRDGYQIEKRYIRKDGRVIWGRLTASVVRREGSPGTSCVGMVEDITQRKEAEQALKDSEARFRAVLENSLDAAYRRNLQTNQWDYMSPVIEQITGFSAEEMNGMSSQGVLDRIHPDDRQGVVAEHARAVETGQGQMECRFKTRSGQYRWLANRFTVLRDSYGRPLYHGGILRDITQRKQREEALARSEQRYRSLFNGMTEGFALHEILCDEKGQPCDYRFLEVNPAFERLTGLKYQEVAGRLVSQVLPGIEPQWLRIYGKVALTGQSVHFEDYSAALQRHFAVFAYRPAPMQFAVLFVDISDRKRAEKVLRQAQKMEAIGVLAGGVAHDFRNQLTIIKGYGEMLRRRFPDTDPVREYAEEILKAAERSTALTASLLAFSRRQHLNPQTTDLNKAIAGMAKSLQSIVGEDIGLSFVPGQGLGSVKIDRGEFQHALINLVANARDAMPQGGQLTIGTASIDMEERTAVADGCTPGSYVQVTVRDTGIGMDPQTLQRIFEPFFTTKPVGAGTGLGLSMVYGFVQQSGGHIDVQSEPGQGATFRMHFPCQAGLAAAADLLPIAGPLPTGSGTILLVEDEDAVRGLVRMILEEYGYTVLDAATGTEAVRIASDPGGRIDLLMTDVVMPGTNGPDLARQIGALRPGMPVLYTSGYTRQALAQRGLDGEQVHLLSKPFSTESVLAAVQSALHAASQGPI